MQIENLNIKIIYQSNKEFHEQALWLEKIWYGRFVRGYVKGNEIYINDEAWYMSKNDKNRLKLHEIGHILGMEHTKLPGGIMVFTGLLRW